MILGISTSLSRFSVVLHNGKEMIYEQQEERASAGKTNLYGMVARALKEAGISPADLMAIAIDIGPGGTSSVRTGVSFANGLCFSLNLPIAGVSSAQLIGMSLKKERPSHTPAVLYKSIKGNYYCGIFEGGEVSFEYAKLPEIARRLDERYEKLALAGNKEVLIALTNELSKAEATITEQHKVSPRMLGDYCEQIEGDLKKYPELPTPLNEANLI